jgi:sigma-B regulation protein RsbU (phosphoserine phosphatase)
MAQQDGYEPRLAVVSSLEAETAEQTWLNPLLGAWPGRRVPEGRLLSYHSACKQLSPHDPCEPGHRSLPSQVVLALAGAEQDEGDVYRLLDAMRRSITPGVLLVREEVARSIRTEDAREMGVIVAPWKTPLPALASMLWTLIRRQPVVDALSREVRLAHLSQRSIAGELDKMHKELHEAARMQRQFVQRGVPYIPGLNVGAIFRPATYVSGDLFDVERLDEHHVSVFLADAVGHGVPAAMLTLFISRALPKVDGSRGSTRVIPPSEALARLNREFCNRPSPGGRFATAVYAVIDTRTMEATVAGAGHPASLVVGRGSGAVSRIESEGPLLGVFPDGDFGETAVRLGDSASLVFFTDGFETAFQDTGASPSQLKMPNEFYIDRLVELGRSGPRREDLADAIGLFESELDAQLGSLHRRDDVTALVITADEAWSAGRVPRAA